MKVILDTNILVSGIFFGGKPFEILSAWEQKKFTLVISHEILNEYIEIVQGLKRRYPKADALEIVKTIAANAEMTLSVALTRQICDDPDDDKFLAAAMASKCKIIVSGDKHLKKVSGWAGIQVFSADAFLKNLH